MTVFNEDKKPIGLTVSSNMKAREACLKLALLDKVEADAHWVLTEYLTDLGLGRYNVLLLNYREILCKSNRVALENFCKTLLKGNRYCSLEVSLQTPVLICNNSQPSTAPCTCEKCDKGERCLLVLWSHSPLLPGHFNS